MKASFRTSRVFKFAACALLLSLLIAACTSAAPATDAPTVPPTDVPTQPPTEPPTAPPTAPPTEPPLPSKPLSGLDANPQRVEFQAEDGKKLVGYYYPSKYADAPIVILIHWAGGDLTDWCKVAPWLQNRADENPSEPERCANAGADLPAGVPTPWLDPSWFPAMNPEASLAVFAFDLRDYGESEAGGAGPNWAKDAKAAFATAAGLEGVDAGRMASIGASIGADGAADGCLLYNQEAGGGCVGALSLSPGNYLGMKYSTVVADLAPVLVWCLAAENDGESAPTCRSASGEHYRSQIYPGNPHGMLLIAPDFDPLPMALIQEFLELVFGEIVK